MESIRFDDIATLTHMVSDEFDPFGPEIHVTQGMIERFADGTGDHRWIHIDVERCTRERRYRQPIAHGCLTRVLIPAWIYVSLPLSHPGVAERRRPWLRPIAP